MAELERIGAAGPIDLVGHDWGGGFVVRVVSTRPELVRSWVTDAGAIGDPDFEWHDFAKIWQTPGEGEEFFAQQLATPADDRAAVFEAFGVPLERARTPGRLGRRGDGAAASWPSTARPSTWAGSGDRTSTTSPRPGWSCCPTEDPFLSADGARVGRRSGRCRRWCELPGLGPLVDAPGPGRRRRRPDRFLGVGSC